MSYLVANSEDRFSRDEAQIIPVKYHHESLQYATGYKVMENQSISR